MNRSRIAAAHGLACAPSIDRRAALDRPRDAITIIRIAIERCAAARDGRGRWRVQRNAEDQLIAAGDSPAIAAASACACAVIGAQIAESAR